MADTGKRRQRRTLTDEFKAGAVRLVLDEGETVRCRTRDLDPTETALREGYEAHRSTEGPQA
jgi:transposase